MADCIFCRIAQHEIPVDSIYEDTDIIAFHDLASQAPVHALVIPKRHLTNLSSATEADSELLGTLLLTTARIARQLGISETGFRIVANVGQDGGQSVDHLHIHLLGGRPLAWPPG